MKRYKTHGADSLKEYMQPRRIQRQWLAMAAAKEGVNITAEGGGDLKTDLSMVLDGYTGVEHSLPVVPIYKDVIQLEAQAGTTYTPTLIVSYGGEFGQFYWRQRMDIHADPKVMRFTPHEQVDSVARRRVLLFDEEYTFPLIAQGAAGIVRNGGHVALGSHGEQQGIGAHWELWMLQSGGMTPSAGALVGNDEWGGEHWTREADRVARAREVGRFAGAEFESVGRHSQFAGSGVCGEEWCGVFGGYFGRSVACGEEIPGVFLEEG